jgi:hypothetical protein
VLVGYDSTSEVVSVAPGSIPGGDGFWSSATYESPGLVGFGVIDGVAC